MLTKEKTVVLTDSYNRTLHKLRVQLTDACNLRCMYCMPDKPVFRDPAKFLTPAEIFNICKVLNEFGVDEIRVTGGEPTIRPEFEEIIIRLSALPLKKLCLTTNGLLLDKKLPFLKETNCEHLNISLDSLNEEKFFRITKGKSFRKVYNSIIKARDLGFRVKINTVLMRDINDNEVTDFINFSADTGIEVRFIELMKIGPAYELNPNLFIPADEIISVIKSKQNLTKIKVSRDSTSFNFLTENGGRIGFIASESKPFCMTCSRLRLSDTGRLRACIMSEKGVELRGRNEMEFRELLSEVMLMKPVERINHIEQPMNQIGG